MNRESEHDPGQPLDQQLDQQLDRLTPKLKETGISPERDLWPDINRALDHVDQIPAIRNRGLTGWRIVALAASVLLLVGVGLVQHGSLPGKSSDYQASLDGTPPSNMEVLDQALADLNSALASDPNNSNLSQLVLMIHKSRGKMIRNAVRRLGAPGE